MKIEDVINSYNECLSIERFNSFLNTECCRGHFVFRKTVNKLLGNYRKFTYTIEFINREMQPVLFVENDYVKQVNADLEERCIREIESVFLTNFFMTLRSKSEEEYKQLLTGEYGVK